MTVLPAPLAHATPDFAHSTRPDLRELSSNIQRRLEVLAHGPIGLIVRVSSEEQLEHAGSLEIQQHQFRHLEPYGVESIQVERYISVESAHGEQERPDFERLLRRVSCGAIRFVVAAFADRVSRNWPQFDRLGAALKAVKGMIMLEGDIFDLSTSKGEFDYRDAANRAVYQSEQRIQRNIVHKCGKAKRLALPVQQPVGYCWASLEDPAYVREIDRQHMRHALGSAPEGHLTNVVRQGLRYLVLPYPDREVYESMVLRRDVLLQTEDIRAVVDMIHTDSAWPRKHHIPVRRRGNLFALTAPLGWADLREYRAMTSRDSVASLLAGWYRSPSLYGVYHWQLGADVDLDDSLRLFGGKVWQPRANPDALFRPEQRGIVKRILSRGDHKLWTVSTDVTADAPRTPRPPSGLRRLGLEPLLPEVRCSVVWQRDEVCEAKLVPLANPDWSAWRLRYRAEDCRHRHPLTSYFGNEAEQLIVQTVFEQLTPEIFRTAVSRIDLKLSVEHGRLTEINRELKLLGEHLAFLRRELQKAHPATHPGLGRQLTKALGEAGERYEQLDRHRMDAEVGLATERAVEARDRARIYRLATRLPELWERAEHVPGARAALMRVLIRRVSVRRIAARMDFVEIEFPSGVRIERIICVSPLITSPAWQQWCLERLRPQLEGDRLTRVTTEDIEEADRVGLALAQEHPWRAGKPYRGLDVRAAAVLALCNVDASTLGQPVGETLTELATRSGATTEELEKHVRLQRFGAASRFGGVMRYQPTEAQLCRWLLSYARGQVARASGWPEDDITPFADYRRLHGLHRVSFDQLVRRAGHMVTDASGRIWIRVSAVEALFPPPLPGVVEALGIAGVTPDDFMPAEDGLSLLEAKSGRRLYPQWPVMASARGYAMVVRARQPGKLLRPHLWLYVPKAIRTATSLALVCRWMDGQAPNLSAWSPMPPRRARSTS
ncbi:MAG: recombinase family protein [Gemmatimonadetes bacterium]|nr:recombinase family protein [Gemmatimonadota bacterium]